MVRRLLAGLVGLLLLLAAVLKLYGLNVAPFAQHGKLLNASVQFVAVEWEIVLGVWLLSGRRPLGAWLAAVLTFAAFAVVSGYLGLIGQASCGCFGAIQASPWVVFAVDVVALVLLGIARPDFRALSAQNRGARRRAILADVGLVAVGLALISSRVRMGTNTDLPQGGTFLWIWRISACPVSETSGNARFIWP